MINTSEKSNKLDKSWLKRLISCIYEV